MKRGSRCTDFLPLPPGEGGGEGAGASQRTAFAWPTLAALGLLAGCAAGSDFQRPPAPTVSSYTAAPLPAQTASADTALGAAQGFAVGAPVDARWWRQLGSQRLDAWIEQAFAASPTLAAAEATLRQADETYAAQAGATLYPQVSGTLGAQRQRLNPSAQGQAGDAREFNLYSAGLGVRYRLDVSGGNRRALEALAARTDQRRHQLDGARLTLAGSLAASAIGRARLAGQIAATEALLGAQQEQQGLTGERVRLGAAAPDELLALQAQTEQTRAGLASLRQQLDQSDHRLAVLAGQAPGAARVPEFTLAEFSLPAVLPVALPSELVRARPDIRAAEALLHAATADHGVAVAKLYPQIELSASLGSQALTAGALFGGASAAWAVLGQLTQPLFNPGLPAEQRAYLAALDAAAANYQGVVLGALREVADTLRALDHDAQALAALAAADAAARATLQSVERQHALGTAAYVQVLLARQQARQAQLGLIAAQAQRLADSAALYQASAAAPEADQNVTSARSHSVRPGSLTRTPPG
ncbi:MAG: efflux transporter outer membrane subunit [Burkholderiaceae bacterium]|nr:efflux transporter outer membrane subunit [Pseudomonadota bacterium]MCO5117573.1 efflux transporter outer membrane subunit [Burkholderiaceae bacterium]MCP5218253.1 efflux transporter outer membrane subunit [Burkholderiaceae bacterium]